MITDQIQDYITHSKKQLDKEEELDEDDLRIYMRPFGLHGHLVVIEGPKKDVCVYENGRFKFHLENPNILFWEHVMKRDLQYKETYDANDGGN